MKKKELTLDSLLRKPMKEVEKIQIEHVLNLVKWQLDKAAKMLGISPSTLYRKRKEFDLK